MQQRVAPVQRPDMRQKTTKEYKTMKDEREVAKTIAVVTAQELIDEADNLLIGYARLCKKCAELEAENESFRDALMSARNRKLKYLDKALDEDDKAGKWVMRYVAACDVLSYFDGILEGEGDEHVR